MHSILVLDDGQTFSEVQGCRILVVDDDTIEALLSGEKEPCDITDAVVEIDVQEYILGHGFQPRKITN